MNKAKLLWSHILYIVAGLACLTGLGFYIATAAGATPVLLDIGIWLVFGSVIVAIVAAALSGRRLID